MKKIYIWTTVISICFIVPGCFASCPVLNVLSSIGCSGVAAAIMAIFIEKCTKEKQEAIKKKAQKAYFQELREELKMMFERIVWFDERMNDTQFDWEKNPAEYSSLNYMVWASKNYFEYSMSYEDIKNKLMKIADKYCLSRLEKMTPEERTKVCKMFNILGVSGAGMIKQIKTINDNKLLLDIVNYMPLDKSKNLSFEVVMAVSLMMSQGKNYGAFVAQLVSAYEEMSDFCEVDRSFRIGVHGDIFWDEL